MNQVGVYEAKTRLPQLLEQVARGHRIIITRHGTPVAMLVPARREGGRPVEDTIRELLAFRKGRRLGRISLRTLVAAGRR
jgi:prevent-host-death family protein